MSDHSGRPGLVLLWSATIISSAGMLLAVAPRAVRTQSDAAAKLARHRTLVSSAEELARLRSAATGGEPNQGAEPKLTSAVSAALSAAGLPVSTLASLSPESENAEVLNPGSGDGIRLAVARRRATLVLSPLSLPQVGRFLAAWRDRAPQWTPVRIDLEPRQDGKVQAAPGSDLPLRATVAIESVSIQSRARNKP